MGLILSGDIIDAVKAEKMGIITELVTPDELDNTVKSWCERIASNAPLAISTSKQTVMKGLDEPTLEAAIRGQAQYPAFSHWVDSEDEVAVSMNISHGGLAYQREFCQNEQVLRKRWEDHPDEAWAADDRY